MALRDTSLPLKATICLQASALIVCLVGFGTNRLVYFETPYVAYNGGLWSTYYNDNYHYNTDDFLRLTRQSSAWLDVSKAMMSISVGLHIVCTCLTVGSAFISSSVLVMWGLAAAEFTAALTGLIGCSVAASELKSAMEEKVPVTFSVSYSFVVFLVAQFAFVGTGLLILLDARMKAASLRSPAPVTKLVTIF